MTNTTAFQAAINPKFVGLTRTNSFADLVEVKSTAMAKSHSDRTAVHSTKLDELETLVLKHDVKLFGGTSWQVALQRLDNYQFVCNLVSFMAKHEGQMDGVIGYIDDVDTFELRQEEGVGQVLYIPCKGAGVC